MFTIDRLVEECLEALDEDRPQVAVADVLRRAVKDPKVSSVLTPDRSAFGVLHRSERLTVLHVALPPSAGSTPHEHLMWAVVGIQAGQEDNAFFRKDELRIEPSGGRSVNEGEVLVMGDDTVHSIRNPRSGYSSAIHVYGGDLMGAPRREWIEGKPRRFENDGPVRLIESVRGEEERLGRGLTEDEVKALISSAS